jgi:DNA adenine methylase
MLSNSATDFIKAQYGNYNLTIVKAKRAINSDATGRGQVDEVVVRNYES